MLHGIVNSVLWLWNIFGKVLEIFLKEFVRFLRSGLICLIALEIGQEIPSWVNSPYIILSRFVEIIFV